MRVKTLKTLNHPDPRVLFVAHGSKPICDKKHPKKKGTTLLKELALFSVCEKLFLAKNLTSKPKMVENPLKRILSTPKEKSISD